MWQVNISICVVADILVLAAEPAATFTTSLTLLRRWSEVGDVEAAELTEALRNVERRGRYRPGPQHPEYRWRLSSLDQG